MKPHKSMLLLPAMLAVQGAFAQSNHLMLSNNYPEASQKIQLAYTPAGTPLVGKKDIAARVYFQDDKDYPVAEMELKPVNNTLVGEFTIPAATQSFFVKVYSGDKVDNNGGKGYIYEVYKDKKPVPGAYESEAYLMVSNIGATYGHIEPKDDRVLELLTKEYETNPDGERREEIAYSYLLAKKTAPAVLVAKIKLLERGSNENDLTTLSLILTNLGKNAAADSVKNVLRVKYPTGQLVREEAISAMEKDVVNQEALYQGFVSRFGDEQNSDLDYVRTQLAINNLKAGNNAAFERYTALVQKKIRLAGKYNSTAYEWALAGKNLEQAEKMLRQALDIIMEKQKNSAPMPFFTTKEAEKSRNNFFNSVEASYAYTLYLEKKYDEAFKYQKDVYEYDAKNGLALNEHYVLILNALAKYAESKAVTEQALRAGQGTMTLNNELKKAYVGLNGNDNGFAEYFEGISKIANQKKREELTKQIINKPAPDFTLKDFNGNVVSLASLKGKVVIIDFWATWCAPCKASFPGMQLAVDKYKNDPDVKFLFIDTWETDNNYADAAKKYITDNKYTFDVLFDDKLDGRQAKVVTQFKVTGIPAKFVIDKNGFIRFTKAGGGETTQIFDEVSSMIELAKEPVPTQVEAVPQQNIKQPILKPKAL